ncbi:MAG: hypothetical protein IKB50_01645 [Clostridia bacterium]|nr:hypothetical protein [Clostridia bacterium]
MTYSFNVDKDRIALKGSSSAVSGSVNYYKCSFDFSPEWNGLLKFAVFTDGDKVYTILVEDDMCTVPAELLLSPAAISVGVYGTSEGDEVFRISTDFSHIVIKEGAYREGTTPTIPEKDAWEIYFARAAEEATKAATDAIKAETGDIDSALDAILDLQNTLIGGEEL